MRDVSECDADCTARLSSCELESRPWFVAAVFRRVTLLHTRGVVSNLSLDALFLVCFTVVQQAQHNFSPVTPTLRSESETCRSNWSDL